MAVRCWSSWCSQWLAGIAEDQALKGEKRHVDRPRGVETLFGSIKLTRDYF